MSSRRCRTPDPGLPPFRFGSGSSRSSGPHKSISTASSTPNLNVTAARNPRIKSNLNIVHVDPTDWDLECDFAYNEYLQSVVKQTIANDIIAKHEQDIKDQLAIRNDRTYQMEELCRLAKCQITSLTLLKEIEEVVDFSQKFVDKFKEMAVENDLEKALMDLRSNLDRACDLLHLKNVQPVKSQDSYDKLFEVIQQCNSAMEQIKSFNQDIEGINNLANTVVRFKELNASVEQKCREIDDLQRVATMEFLNNVSDMYAQRNDNYN